ncbi:hypothetical protein SORBI_3009G165950 [Sorghum bicolor]|uniref:Uncharacterized protein n=1 Tax=Sorghum bicolor TaxID=4558 RepID=A0A1Z5R321_SORBI|nr:hypothetical protein SORBI_3009G165950 [Sorghum bicolor]
MAAEPDTAGEASRLAKTKHATATGRRERCAVVRTCLRSRLASGTYKPCVVCTFPTPRFGALRPRSTPPAKLSLPLLPPPLHRCPPPIPLSLGRPLDPSISKAFLPSIAIAIDRLPVVAPCPSPVGRLSKPTTSRPVTVPCSAPAGRSGFIWCAATASPGMAFHEVETPRRC